MQFLEQCSPVKTKYLYNLQNYIKYSIKTKSYLHFLKLMPVLKQKIQSHSPNSIIIIIIIIMRLK